MVKTKIKNIENQIIAFYSNRKDNFIIFSLAAVLLFYLRVNPLFPYYLTERKLFYILFILFFIIFKISSRIITTLGLIILSIIALLALFNRMAAVNTFIIYSWGFLLLAAFVQVFELSRFWWAKNDKK